MQMATKTELRRPIRFSKLAATGCNRNDSAGPGRMFTSVPPRRKRNEAFFAWRQRLDCDLAAIRLQLDLEPGGASHGFSRWGKPMIEPEMFYDLMVPPRSR
jgi:hypothetical protein